MTGIEEMAEALKQLASRGKILEELNRSEKGELFILKYLYTKNASASPSELGEALDSSAARISTALGVLEKKGEIHREIDPNNRRFILVTITEAGNERISAVLEQMHQNLIQVLTEMGEKDAGEFVRLSTRFFEIAERIMLDSCKP